ncbi:hypothetical protein JCM10908_007383 [Rhodotorula pacifica]|uniref:uncharacterized protein n=1 Tax=Rhodotorula pacifica TaxID=1495444 RepID=UPI00316CD78E
MVPLPDVPGQTGTSSLIGVALAIGAGVLIALGLNSHSADTDERTPLLRERSREGIATAKGNGDAAAAGPRVIVAVVDGEPTAEHAASSSRKKARDVDGDGAGAVYQNGTRKSSRSRSRHRTISDSGASSSCTSHPHKSHSFKRKGPRLDKGFLRNKLWLLGFGLMNSGELCNFLAYAFAPPSVVAPLGMVTLVANVFLAPLIVREPFRRKDLVGVAIAVIGGATVVYASHSNDTKPTPHQFQKAISRPLFIAYSITSFVLICVLAWLSRTRYGDRFVLIDLALCALAGAFTVLSTKAISSFLNLMFLDTFKHWITYPVLLVLVITAILQVNFVNKSLQRFESRVVIPIQYMTFALSTIVGSAILYRDFEGIGLPSLLNFAFGCLVSGGGVYLLTRDAPSSDDTDEDKPSATDHKKHEATSSSTTANPAGTSAAVLPPNATANATILLDLPATSLPSASSHSSTSPSIATSTSPAKTGHLLPVPVSVSLSRPQAGNRARTVSLTLGGGYLLAASPGAIRRASAGLRERAGEEEEGDGVEGGEEEEGGSEGSDGGSDEEEENGSDGSRRRRRRLGEGEC